MVEHKQIVGLMKYGNVFFFTDKISSVGVLLLPKPDNSRRPAE